MAHREEREPRQDRVEVLFAVLGAIHPRLALAGVREYQQQRDAINARKEAEERAQKEAQGIIVPDEIQPAPPAPPTPPPPTQTQRPADRDEPDELDPDERSGDARAGLGGGAGSDAFAA